MKKREIVLICLSLLIFLSLVFYNYLRAQKQIREVRETQFKISFTQKPEKADKNTPTTFEWLVSAPESFSASRTVLFWSYESSPAALNKTDSPDAVRYTYSSPDYSQGYFRLPDRFSVNLTFPKSGNVYYRSYAQIGNDNIWSDEQIIRIQ